ncbi:MAG TPA: hypothetical protein VJ306_19700 [Pyrinomonadaceae bacterium]|nr:hypothetical protein [Pyrinomonadaceae bacterium]
MPKDNENIPFLGPVEPSEPQGFPAEQMIRCEECLRANPPTRVSCLYCVAPLPLTETSARLIKPVLRPPEKHQVGYNNILLPQDQVVADSVIADAAALLKLSVENVRDVISQSVALPVTRTASRVEAELVTDRLRELGLNCVAVSDDELGDAVRRVRSMTFDEVSLTINQAGTAQQTRVLWSDIVLIVTGRFFETRVEITERMTRKPENEILDTSEFFSDEFVIDFYTATHSSTWRVGGSGFDFSCLGREKALVVNQNMSKLLDLITAKSLNAKVDDSYARVRNLLELAWTTQPVTQSSGWRRERPGKLSVGVSTTRSNEVQFTRYSRLRYYLSRG